MNERAIPAEAVDAAGEHLPTVWTGNPVYRAELVAALEAAAPYLMAEAWDEGSREGYKERALENDTTGRYGNSTVKDNPYRRAK